MSRSTGCVPAVGCRFAATSKQVARPSRCCGMVLFLPYSSASRSVGRHQESKRTEIMDQACCHVQLELFEQDHPQWDWFPDEVRTRALGIIALLLAEHVANTLEETDAEPGD